MQLGSSTSESILSYQVLLRLSIQAVSWYHVQQQSYVIFIQDEQAAQCFPADNIVGH